MRTRRMWAAAAVLTVAALVGAGCGDDDDDAGAGQDESSSSTTESTADVETPTRDEYVEAMAAGDEGSDFTDEEGDCIYGAFVDGYGVDALVAAGVTPDDIIAADEPGDLGIEFSDAQADALYEHMTGCVDVRRYVVDGMTEESSAEEAACIEANVTDDLVELLMVVALTQGDEAVESDPELMSAMMSALGPCLALGAEGT